MESLPSSLADNASEWLHNNQCEDSKSCHEYAKVKDKLLISKYLNCNKYHKNTLIKT